MARPRRRRRRDAALALAALVLALPFCLDLGRRRATRASGAPTDAVAVWDRGVYTPRRRPPPEPRAPALVRAWRRGRVDWHDVAGGDERAATDFLTRYAVWQSTGLRARALSRVEHAWNWCPHRRYRRYVADTNRDAGPLAPYEACAALKDGCALHDAAACARNSFCAWDGRTEVCAAAAASGPGKKPCAAMTRIAGDGRLVAADACDGPIVTERVVVTRAPEDARMFFHWWRFFKALVGSAIRRGRGAVARDTHYVLAGDAPAPFLPYLGLLSDFCYRRTEEVRDACFCAAEALYVRSRAGLIFRGVRPTRATAGRPEAPRARGRGGGADGARRRRGRRGH